MNICIRKQLTSLIKSSLIQQLSQELNLVQRQRKARLTDLVWTIIFAGLSEHKQSLESLRPGYIRVTGSRMARSSFYQRFSPQLGQLLRARAEKLMCQGKASASQPKQLSLHQRLKDFGIEASGFTNVRILVPISVVTIEEFSHAVGIILVILSAAKNLCYNQIDPSCGSRCQTRFIRPIWPSIYISA